MVRKIKGREIKTNKFMNQETKIELIKRLKSFLWRLGGISAIALIGFISENLGMFDLPVWMVGIIGLILGEATKWINNKGITLGKLRMGGRGK